MSFKGVEYSDRERTTLEAAVVLNVHVNNDQVVNLRCTVTVTVSVDPSP